MKPREKVFAIIKYTIPLILMIGMIAITENGAILTLVYILVALFYFWKHSTKLNYLAYTLGLLSMTLFESLFLLTGVETFADKTLFGIMPLWLPFLWAYGFLVIKDSLLVLIND